MLFDDYGFATCPGARLAVNEFFVDKPERIIELPTGQAFVIKITKGDKVSEKSDDSQQSSEHKSIERLVWTPELVEQFWTGVAQTRLTEFSFSRQAGKSFVIAVENHLSKQGTHLDYGSGDGDLIECFLERGYQIAAYEPSTGRRNKLLARFKQKDGFLGIVDHHNHGQFDVILMVEVIEHIIEQEFDLVLRRVTSMLKRNGILIVTTPNHEDLELGMVYCPISNMLFHRWQHVRSFTPESLATVLRTYGIDQIVIHQIEFRNDFFIPYDQEWAGDKFINEVPSYINAMRKNIPVRVGSENVILFIGRKLV
jgi:2-polyprenyl-3-methyl-5-hydroxy-6-metoxy-1,4-benzoquinol methylase